MYLKDSNPEIAAGRFVLLDTDFISAIFEDADFLKESLTTFKDATFFIDPFVRIEFLRDIFLSKQYTTKQKFIDNETIFVQAVWHPEHLKRILDNTLILSQIYAHQFHSKSKGKVTSSLVDLMLAGRAMLHNEASFILTGNKRDYPSAVFDVKAVFNYENPDGSLRTYCLIEFNKNKFETCYASLQRMPQ